MKKTVAKRKSSSRGSRTPKRSHIGWRIVYFFGIAAIVLSGVFFLKMKPPTPQCANSISCIKELSGRYEERTQGEFEGKKVMSPPLAAKPFPPESFPLAMSNVLGASSGDTKHIFIDLTNQKLTAYENNALVYEFPVSTGKWGLTPTGDFRIWIKLRYTRMRGGNKAIGTFYDLPNVPYTMYFYSAQVPKSRGYGIHGAYWHNNFGHPMSHGCVNMREADVAKLYEWAMPSNIVGGETKNIVYASAEQPGTLITIFGTTPNN